MRGLILALCLLLGSCGTLPASDHRKGQQVEGPDEVSLNPEPGRDTCSQVRSANPEECKHPSTFIVPLLFFEGDVGPGGGVILSDHDFRDQNGLESARLGVTYTTEGQQSYMVFWRRALGRSEPREGTSQKEVQSFVHASAGYRRTLTRRFFGLGPDSLKSDESIYTEEAITIGAGLSEQLPLGEGRWFLTSRVRLESRNLGGMQVSGVPPTQDTFTAEFEDADDVSIGWLDLGLRCDTTSGEPYPREGITFGLWLKAAPLLRGGTSGAHYGLDGTYIVPLPGLFEGISDLPGASSRGDALAFSARVEDSSGDLPFWALPSLGGASRLKGYSRNRWTDEAAWYLGAEYLALLRSGGMVLGEGAGIDWVGVAAFLEMGSVGPDVASLPTSQVRHSYGVSLQVQPKGSPLFRLDLGFSEEGPNLSVGYGLGM